MGEIDGGGTRYLRRIAEYPGMVPLSQKCYGPDGIGWAEQDAGVYGDTITTGISDSKPTHRRRAELAIEIGATVRLSDSNAGGPDPVL